MEEKRVGDTTMKMKMKEVNKNLQKEISDHAAPAPQQAAAVGSWDSAMFQSLNLPWGRKIVGKDELTIFYGGKVRVFESIPADKAREIMLMAIGAAAANYNQFSSSSSSSSPSPLPLIPPPSIQTTATNAFNPLSKLKAAELPITRSYSLQRFLEKRRDRLVNRGPYSTNEDKITTAKRPCRKQPSLA